MGTIKHVPTLWKCFGFLLDVVLKIEHERDRTCVEMLLEYTLETAVRSTDTTARNMGHDTGCRVLEQVQTQP